MKKLIQFGAGNIGRSFIGQLFSRAGYEVVFVDVADALIRGLNNQKSYRVVVKYPDRPEEILTIENVRAVDGRDADAVARELVDADIVATAVGQRALPAVVATLAEGLKRRWEAHGPRPLDIILAENLHGAADWFRKRLIERLPADYPIHALVGLVETSIGKMVPIMRAEDLAVDPLWVFAEPYNRLILDRRGFINPIPDVPGLAPMDNMAAYVDRKLYIHNLGHATTAYLGYRAHPERTTIYEVMADAAVTDGARCAMTESLHILNRLYPNDLTVDDLIRHREDLLARFANRALGDTVFRVGRDLRRKLAKEDRLVGAMILGARHGLPFGAIARAYVAGLGFRARDEHGELGPGDRTFIDDILPRGPEAVLTEVSGLSRLDATESAVMDAVLAAHKELET